MTVDEVAVADDVTKRVRTGRMLVCLVVFLLMVMTALTFALSMRLQGATALSTHGIRAVIFVALCVFLYRGHEWASTTLALASAYGGITGIGSAMRVNKENGFGPAFALVASMALAYLLCAVLLFFAPSIKTFLRQKLPAK